MVPPILASLLGSLTRSALNAFARSGEASRTIDSAFVALSKHAVPVAESGVATIATGSFTRSCTVLEKTRSRKRG